jgi:hypothetical protein
MISPLAIAAILAGGTGFLLALVVRELLSARRIELVDAEWVSRFSVAKYRPMLRLIAAEDFQYLARQRGYHPRIAGRLRRERTRVFRGYLKCMRHDYRKLEAAMALWMMNSPADRPDLARDLLRRRLTFTLAVLAAKWRLLLYAHGLESVDPNRLLDALSDMRLDLRRAVLVRQATLA